MLAFWNNRSKHGEHEQSSVNSSLGQFFESKRRLLLKGNHRKPFNFVWGICFSCKAQQKHVSLWQCQS
jgi:hypothetical protein